LEVAAEANSCITKRYLKIDEKEIWNIAAISYSIDSVFS
jgi:hypothetical protein